jgi:hypothetical protein
MMDIYAKPGTKVVFCNLDWGYAGDQEWAKKHLFPGQIYTVDHTEVYNWSSDVILKEVPGVKFNTVLFEEIEEEAVS